MQIPVLINGIPLPWPLAWLSLWQGHCPAEVAPVPRCPLLDQGMDVHLGDSLV